MKTAVVVLLAILAQAVGNTCLSKGMKAVASMNTTGDSFSLGMLVEAMGTPSIWIGTVLLVVFFALFATALSWADLSLVLPATALGYILNVVLAHQYLNETVSFNRWAGTVLIFLGVLLVSSSSGKRLSGSDP